MTHDLNWLDSVALPESTGIVTAKLYSTAEIGVKLHMKKPEITRLLMLFGFMRVRKNCRSVLTDKGLRYGVQVGDNAKWYYSVVPVLRDMIKRQDDKHVYRGKLKDTLK